MTTFSRLASWVMLTLLMLILNTEQTSVADVRIPPTIVSGPAKQRIFRPGDVIRLECAATGRPENIEYEWLHNGEPLNLNLNQIRPIEDGTFEISDASPFNEGFYQCFARNQWGTALSNTSHLQRAVLKIQGGLEQSTRQMTAEEGKPFTILASPPTCFPKPSYDWETGRVVDNAPTKLVLNRRVQADENGNLHFAYATMGDALTNDKVYKCIVTNPHLDIKSGGSYSKVTVHRSASGIKPFAPQISFHTESPKVVVEGQDVSLRCFFAGYPEPTIVWKRQGRDIQGGRFIVQNFESELIIKKVEPSDEGEYVCSASNIASSRHEERTIFVDVQAAPVFRNANLSPRDVNVTEGESVSLHCGTYAEPDADVVWMQNGKKLNPNALPPKFRLSNSNRNLTIVNVCKNCGTEKSDLQVIQCNASNTHGYAFAAGYINVLLKTKIVNKDEEDEHYIGPKDQGQFIFSCEAESDDSTPVSIRWYKLDDSNEEHVHVHNVSDKIVLGRDGSLAIKLASNDSDGWTVHGGTYICKANNGYSSDERIVRILVKPTEPVDPEYVGEVDSVVTASILDLWWIFVIIAALLLLLIILICCCFYCQRNKGDTYPVDEKERENGNNPEKELLDNGFQNYHRPSEDPIKGSQASLMDSWQKINGDGMDADQCSLDEYGDPEIGKFAEDGSFVGAYNATNDRRNRGRTGSQGNY